MTATGPRVLVAGDGIVGLAAALACADRGLATRVIGRRLAGNASLAAAGLLAPSLGSAASEVRAIMVAGRDAWPEFAARLSAATGAAIAVNRLGILEVAPTSEARDRLFDAAPPWAEPVDAPELARLEPSLAGAAGALLHPHDGAADNVAALHALDAACAARGVTRVDGLVRAVDLGADRVTAVTDRGERHEGDVVVVAAGAWAPAIGGLPRALPVSPWRGQMLALDGMVTTRCVAGPGGYLVPRGGRTLAGSTMESVGFDDATTDEAIASLRRGAAGLVAELGAAGEVARWAGLRPMTPDLLPIVGPDPEERRVVYGCGLSKNGILLAPVVAEAIADWCGGTAPRHDMQPFGIARFEGRVT